MEFEDADYLLTLSSVHSRYMLHVLLILAHTGFEAEF